MKNLVIIIASIIILIIYLYFGKKVETDSLTHLSEETISLGTYCRGLEAQNSELNEIKLNADLRHWQLNEISESDAPPSVKGKPFLLSNSGVSSCWLGFNSETKKLENFIYLPD